MSTRQSFLLFDVLILAAAVVVFFWSGVCWAACTPSDAPDGCALGFFATPCGRDDQRDCCLACLTTQRQRPPAYSTTGRNRPKSPGSVASHAFIPCNLNIPEMFTFRVNRTGRLDLSQFLLASSSSSSTNIPDTCQPRFAIIPNDGSSSDSTSSSSSHPCFAYIVNDTILQLDLPTPERNATCRTQRCRLTLQLDHCQLACSVVENNVLTVKYSPLDKFVLPAPQLPRKISTCQERTSFLEQVYHTVPTWNVLAASQGVGSSNRSSSSGSSNNNRSGRNGRNGGGGSGVSRRDAEWQPTVNQTIHRRRLCGGKEVFTITTTVRDAICPDDNTLSQSTSVVWEPATSDLADLLYSHISSPRPIPSSFQCLAEVDVWANRSVVSVRSKCGDEVAPEIRPENDLDGTNDDSDNDDDDYSDNDNGPGSTCPNRHKGTLRWYSLPDECNGTRRVVREHRYTVNDTIPPQILTNPLPPLETRVRCASQVDAVLENYSYLNVTDNCLGAFRVEPDFDGILPGTQECANRFVRQRHWTITDGCNVAQTVEMNVVVDDDQPPRFAENFTTQIAPSNLVIQCERELPRLPPLTNIQVYDECDGTAYAMVDEFFDDDDDDGTAATDVNTNSSSSSGSTTGTTTSSSCPDRLVVRREWTARDQCGNEVRHEQVIRINDTTPPSFHYNVSGVQRTCLWPPNGHYLCFRNFTRALQGFWKPDNCRRPLRFHLQSKCQARDCLSDDESDCTQEASSTSGDNHQQTCLVDPLNDLVCMKLERPEGNRARRYRVTMVASDACGNETPLTFVFLVPGRGYGEERPNGRLGHPCDDHLQLTAPSMTRGGTWNWIETPFGMATVRQNLPATETTTTKSGTPSSTKKHPRTSQLVKTSSASSPFQAVYTTSFLLFLCTYLFGFFFFFAM